MVVAVVETGKGLKMRRVGVGVRVVGGTTVCSRHLHDGEGGWLGAWDGGVLETPNRRGQAGTKRELARVREQALRACPPVVALQACLHLGQCPKRSLHSSATSDGSWGL